jgi:hypothetical protein
MPARIRIPVGPTRRLALTQARRPDLMTAPLAPLGKCREEAKARSSKGEKQQRREAAKAVPSMPRMLCSDEARRLLSIHVSVAHTWTPLCHSNQAGPSPLPRAGQSSSRRHLYVLSAARLVHLTGW